MPLLGATLETFIQDVLGGVLRVETSKWDVYINKIIKTFWNIKNILRDDIQKNITKLNYYDF